ncbi:MAG: NAD(+)/NADH kinase [Defluviitaleaceae bacterium]|nr:NAD(+)/NADH kinase [Defluviitaleaceae bacterium]
MNDLIRIVANETKDPCFEYVKDVENFLRGRGLGVDVLPLADTGGVCLGARRARFCVVLGGDGTMLRVAHSAAFCKIPLLGINLGNLGFLTDVDRANGIGAIEKVLDGNFVTEKRLMLEAEFGAEKIVPLRERIALNEVYLGVSGKLTEFTIYINEQRMTRIRADGILVATPTGSTAYNLAAGGPILMPGGQMMVITPVCPHGLSARPWVTDATDTVRVVAKQSTQVIVDGDTRGAIPAGESVLIKKSGYHATIIRTTTVNFYKTLEKKKLV